jgi:membrane protease YdiL (CAAX protease family)
VPGAAALAATVLNAIIEEAAFRGVLVLHLARHMRFWIANLVGGVAFVAVHLPTFVQVGDPGVVVVMSASLLALALALGAATHATRSIWIAVVAHTVNNLLAP